MLGILSIGNCEMRNGEIKRFFGGTFDTDSLSDAAMCLSSSFDSLSFLYFLILMLCSVFFAHFFNEITESSISENRAVTHWSSGRSRNREEMRQFCTLLSDEMSRNRYRES